MVTQGYVVEAILNELLAILSVISLQHALIAGALMLTAVVCYVSEKRALARNTDKPQLLEQLEQALSCYSTYGCSDAPRFPHCIHDKKRAEILSRYENIPVHRLRYEAEANKSAAITSGKHYSDYLIGKLSKLIDQATSGCCTTLAISATQKLLKLIDETLPGHRIEMVTSAHGMGSHCFILFDRAGVGSEGLSGTTATDGVSYPNLDDWGNSLLIIDPWAQSLGHGNGVYCVENYPFSHYLSNLTQTYDSQVDHIAAPSSSHVQPQRFSP